MQTGAKQNLDPDFVIMARCDLGGVPGASFAEIIERCQAYKAEAQVDVVCPNGLRTWEEIRRGDPPHSRARCPPHSGLTCRRILLYRRSRMPGPPRLGSPR